MSEATSEYNYAGSELSLFAAVRNWKSYWSANVRPYVRGDVLEVGAGIGSNTPYLDPGGCTRWVCLEPDARLLSQLAAGSEGRQGIETVCGDIRSLDPARKFDTIVYIDVLEHIEDDRQELRAAAALLRPGGRVIVLAPAHQALFTPFDTAVGHYRRYNRRTLAGLTPPGLRAERIWYLDSLGMALSAANLLISRQSMPTAGQLWFWDKIVIPISRVMDRCIFRSAGKTVIGVWQAPG